MKLYILTGLTTCILLLPTAYGKAIHRPYDLEPDVKFAQPEPNDKMPQGQSSHGQIVLSPSPEDVLPSALSLIEIAPGVSRYVTEEEKWALRLEGVNFMDITDTEDLGSTYFQMAMEDPITWTAVRYPSTPAHNSTVQPMLSKLNKTNMRTHLEHFTSFHTRYYKSDYGRQSSEWLLKQVNKTVANSGALKHGASVRRFTHPWAQNSIIAQIPGKSNRTIVIGAHQDSINLFLPSILAAPGADDDGSGTVTILEALRVLLQSDDVVKGKSENTIEFHWYSAEEGGLLGSQAIFKSYENARRDIKAMLQQDMTGYVQKTLDAGKEESVGVITDFVDEGLTEFIKTIVKQVCLLLLAETSLCPYGLMILNMLSTATSPTHSPNADTHAQTTPLRQKQDIPQHS